MRRDKVSLTCDVKTWNLPTACVENVWGTSASPYPPQTVQVWNRQKPAIKQTEIGLKKKHFSPASDWLTRRQGGQSEHTPRRHPYM